MVSGWEKSSISAVAKVYRGASPRPIQKYLTSQQHGVNWIKIGDVNANAKFINSTIEKISLEGSLFSHNVQKGDLVLSNSMSFGRPYIMNTNGCIHDGWLTIQDYDAVFDTHFLYYSLGDIATLLQYEKLAAGSGVKNLNKKLVEQVILPIPPLPEQQAIATALSDIDEYIAALDKLIRKKQDIKQGAMQELLTGKRRLPGYDVEWQAYKLINNSNLKARIGWQGLTSSEYLKEGYSLLVTGTDFCNGKIQWNTCHYVSKNRYEQDSHIQLKNGDILISKDGTIGKIAIVENLHAKATLNSGIFVLRSRHLSFHPFFLYYILSSHLFTDFLEKLTAGSTINHLYQKDFITFQYFAPIEYKEQTAIAEVLYDMDSEIYALKAKRKKAEQVKRGMMSELLTGRIRLVDEQDAPQAATSAASKTKPSAHPKAYEDAVLYTAITQKFYSPNYPLGRKKIQKCLYLLRCHLKLNTDDFKKKAAGPYSADARYNGGEGIACKKGYIIEHKNKMGSRFELGANYEEALTYVDNWGMRDAVEWVAQHLKYKKVDELEVLATVDRCIRELLAAGQSINVDTIKQHIGSIKEWAPKLKKDYFADHCIQMAIDELRTLLGKTYVKQQRK